MVKCQHVQYMHVGGPWAQKMWLYSFKLNMSTGGVITSIYNKVICLCCLCVCVCVCVCVFVCACRGSSDGQTMEKKLCMLRIVIIIIIYFNCVKVMRMPALAAPSHKCLPLTLGNHHSSASRPQAQSLLQPALWWLTTA